MAQDAMQSSLRGLIANAKERTGYSNQPEAVRKPSRVNVHLIRPSDDNPRRYFDRTELERLGESIRQQQVEPISVRAIEPSSERPERFEIIAGERRWRAAKAVGLDTVDIVVHDVDERTARFMRLAENMYREDLSAFEETSGILKLIAFAVQENQDALTEFPQKPGDLEERVKRALIEIDKASKRTDAAVFPILRRVSEGILNELGKHLSLHSFVRARLPLLELPADLLTVIREGRISASHALELNKVADPTTRQALIRRIESESLSVRDTKAIVKGLLTLPADKKKSLRTEWGMKQLRRSVSLERITSLDAKEQERAWQLLEELQKLLKRSKKEKVENA